MYPQQYPPSAPPPSSYPNQVGFNSLPQTNDERMRKFQHLVDRYEINREFATRLRGLEGYEIAFIVDGKKLFFYKIIYYQIYLDSGSMNTPLGKIFLTKMLRYDE
jgi:hypothetical protein